MYRQILIRKKFSLKDRIKNTFLYIYRKRGAQRSWKKRHEKVLKANKNYKRACSAEIEKEHQNIWSDFRNHVDTTTLRISSNISGKMDARMVPEDIFVSDIEPTLKTDNSVDFIGNKSFYNQWFPKGIFPKDLFHRIDGQFLKPNLDVSNYDEFKKISNGFKFPIVLKPNHRSYGGKDINIIERNEELLEKSSNKNNFVIQEKIKQHKYFNEYNPHGLNTIKVFLYRSVKDNKMHILSMALRMGKDRSLDNEAAGGINTFINNNGYLNGYAIDKLGKKYYEHPNTKKKFDGRIPDFEDLKTLSLKVGHRVFLTRILGLDACYDQFGNWRIIEVNTFSQSIRFSQYGGQPFFGKFTNEVIEYCKMNHWATS